MIGLSAAPAAGAGGWALPPPKGQEQGEKRWEMDRAASLHAYGRRLTNRFVNPFVVAAIDRGFAPPTYALVETVGRRTGRRRLVPVANGLDGDTFWLIAGLGENANYVRNIRANPRVRVRARPARLRDGLRLRWRSGTALPLPDDDARARHQSLGRGRPGYRLDGILLRGLAAGGDMLTVRIDLD